MADFVPRPGDIVVCVFNVPTKRGDRTREVFGEVKRVTATRVLVQTLKIGFASFSKRESWAPLSSARPATPRQEAYWRKAIGECDALVRAVMKEGGHHGCA